MGVGFDRDGYVPNKSVKNKERDFMIDWKRKLTSRKFWAALADFVGMLLIAMHVAETTATQVTALIMAGAGVIAYIIGEGMADSATNLEQLSIEKVLYDDADDNNPGGGAE